MDDSKCKESVMWDSWHSRQCTRKIWKDGFCKQHHPETVKERQKESQRKWEERRKKEPWYLLKIAQERIAELEAEVARLSTLNIPGERICEPSAGSKYAPTDGSTGGGS